LVCHAVFFSDNSTRILLWQATNAQQYFYGNFSWYFFAWKRVFYLSSFAGVIGNHQKQPLRTWLRVILIFIILFINIDVLVFHKEPFDPAPTDGNGNPSGGQTGDQ
jgi:hypothetical protein